MRKIFRKLHLWLAIPLGIIITIICLSGAILVFQDNINEIVHSDRYFLKELGHETIPVGKLMKMVNSKLDDNSVVSVQVSSDPNRNYIIGLKEGNRASIYVNPYTAEITGKTERGSGIFSVLLRLHRWLLDDSRTIGKPIVGYTTLFFVLILISGAFIWWPKTKKQLKLQLKVKTKNGWKRFWADMHTSAGIYVCIGLLVLALTGLTYSFSWYSDGFYKLFGVEASSQRNGKGKPESDSSKKNSEKRDESRTREKKEYGQESKSSDKQRSKGVHPYGNRPQQDFEDKRDRTSVDTLKAYSDSIPKKENESHDSRMAEWTDARSWQKVLVELKEKNPNYRTISIQDGSATVSQSFTFGNVRASDKYNFDPETGLITYVQLYKDQPKATKKRGWVYTLHIGAWGGMFSKIITCMIALVGASLPLTGYYIFFLKRKKKKHKAKS